MNETLKKFADASAELFGMFFGWMYTAGSAVANSQFVTAIFGVVAFFVAMFVAYKIISWAFRKVRSIVLGARSRYHRMVRRIEKNAVFARMKGKFMARWTNQYMSDRFEDIILEAEVAGIISDQQGRRLRKNLANAMGLSDLMPRKLGKKLRQHFFGATTAKGYNIPPTYQKLAGPTEKFSAAGGPPGPTTPPNVVKSATLEKMRQKKSAA